MEKTRTSATGRPAKKTPPAAPVVPAQSRGRGITLLEILIVVAIVGIIAALAGINVGQSEASRLKKAAKQLYLQMRLAREDSVILNRQYGLSLDANASGTAFGYGWLMYQERGEVWRDFSGGGLRRSRFPPGTELNLTVEDEEVRLGDGGSPFGFSDGEEEEKTPQILFLSSGEVTPFTLELKNEGAGGGEDSLTVIEGDVIGRIKLRHGEE